MWTWLKSVKDGFKRRFSWSKMQPSEMAAEQYFVERAWKFERFGWDRTKIRTRGLPLKYRFMPDYVVTRARAATHSTNARACRLGARSCG